MAGGSPIRFAGRSFDVDGRRIYALVSVPGPADAVPLVLVPGLLSPGASLMPLAERLAPRFPVFVPALPGVARGQWLRQTLDVDGLADVLAAWAAAAGLERAAFLGCSTGCQVVVALAERHPRRVARLVLVSPTLDPRARSIPRQLARWLWSGVHEPAALGRLLRADEWRGGLFHAARSVRAVLQDRVEVRLPFIEAPTLIVRGGRDPLVPRRWVEEMLRRLPRASLQVIAGAGHAIARSAPDELSRRCVPFLAQERWALPANVFPIRRVAP